MDKVNDIAVLMEPLEVALGLELEGKKFFSDAADTVTGAASKHTFQFLAAEEERHIRRIREYYQSLQKSGTNALPEVGTSDVAHRLERFNESLAELRSELRPSLTDVDAYRTALKFENGAEEFYLKQAEKAGHPQMRRFYQWLVAEEGIHSQVLESCIKFAEDPAGWFKNRSQ
jgi:rubrerythrin